MDCFIADFYITSGLIFTACCSGFFLQSEFIPDQAGFQGVQGPPSDLPEQRAVFTASHSPALLSTKRRMKENSTGKSLDVCNPSPSPHDLFDSISSFSPSLHNFIFDILLFGDIILPQTTAINLQIRGSTLLRHRACRL